MSKTRTLLWKLHSERKVNGPMTSWITLKYKQSKNTVYSMTILLFMLCRKSIHVYLWQAKGRRSQNKYSGNSERTLSQSVSACINQYTCTKLFKVHVHALCTLGTCGWTGLTLSLESVTEVKLAMTSFSRNNLTLQISLRSDSWVWRTGTVT